MGASECFPFSLLDKLSLLICGVFSKCGSVPLYFPSDNNPNDHGSLVFNYVGTGCGKSGACV